MASAQKPLVLALVSDLFFTSRIESAATRAGCQVEYLETVEMLRRQVKDSPPGDDVESRGSPPTDVQALLGWLDYRRPALVIFDLDHPALPVVEWIQTIKSSPAASRLRVVAFGAHVEVVRHRAALAAGADQVFAKSRFVQVLPTMMGGLVQDRDP